MMGRLNHDQRQLFYSFCLDEVVPDDHLVRAIASVLDLSWVHKEFAPYYPTTGRPSIEKPAQTRKPPMMRQYDLIERVRRYNPATNEDAAQSRLCLRDEGPWRAAARVG